MKKAGVFICLLLGGMLMWGALEFPGWGDPSSPASTHLSPYYIENSIPDTSVPNVVTAILADYRGFDTLFETIVIFAAGLVCMFLLRNYKTGVPDSRVYRHIPTGTTLRIEKEGLEKVGTVPEDSPHFEEIDSVWVPYDLVIRTTCRMIIPFIQLFGLYVIAHGHHSPGGGFQGGVILGASVVLFALGFNLRLALKQMNEKQTLILCALGVLIYTGTGVLCVLLGAGFLDYGILANLFKTDPVTARSHGILIVEIGVGMAVMATMILLYLNLASAGKHHEGL
ncbi:MAG: Na(+)/H(+) antiporter subunit B [Desulfobacterales bacterium]|nr:Na(+)/H(+) antiporter subunit B [Desulfobacterales bacterium]